jgi:membrane protease YdiL (CAAX protease family)
MRRIFFSIFLFSILLFITVTACQALGGVGICQAVSDNSLYLGSGAIHLGLLSLAFFFLWKKDLKTTLQSIGFPGEPVKVVVFSVLCLMAIFLLLFTLAFASLLLGFNDQQKVTEKISDLPLLVLLFAAVGAPITEELFFRGYLTGRIGIVASSAVFGLMHLAYGSVVEIVGAFVIGLVLASTMKLSKSVTPCILAHMAYNTLAIIVMRLVI